MNEAETRTEHIDPALRAAGWGVVEGSRILREPHFCQAGPLAGLLRGHPLRGPGGYFQGRYYQDIAIERVLEAIAAGDFRILLTLATGTGKTFIAFQIAWKLFHSRWNLSREPTRRPRILFLTDRNILANQGYNAFSAFPEDALVRIAADEIRKKGKVPKNGSIFFTIFQTFMNGPGDTVYFGVYPADFNKNIEIQERERKRVEIFMSMIDRREKTLVFCARISSHPCSN